MSVGGCDLNPQPEPPSATNDRAADAGSNSNFGGSSGGTTSAPVPTSTSAGGEPQTATGGSGGSSGPGFDIDASTSATDAGSDATVVGAVEAGSDATNDGAPTGPCTTSGSSTLAGVSIHFPAQRCTFSQAEALAGVTFQYEVVIEHDVAGVLSGPQDWGHCDGPGPGGLYVLPTISGNGQSYCICDVGLCPQPLLSPNVLTMGTYSGTFFWDGVNWIGPSDTGNPKGDPFPAGVYTLSIRGTGLIVESNGGTTPYEVVGTMDVTIVP